MTDRAELLEATLACLPEGVGLLGRDSHVMFWNQAGEAITGYPAADLVGRPVLETLRPLFDGPGAGEESAPEGDRETGRGAYVHAAHRLGHEVSAMTRRIVLRDEMGHRIGHAALFHPADCLDALPQGEPGEDGTVAASQDDLKQRLDSAFDDFTHAGPAFGVLWITVDQAHDLRKTHGAGAREAMFTKVVHSVSQGLRPAEYLGRWGEDEFLVISHERTQAMLEEHAQVLARLARTADFRWWGDRVALTASIGAAQVEKAGTLIGLLERAKAAMVSSSRAGGNQITCAPEGDSCSPS